MTKDAGVSASPAGEELLLERLWREHAASLFVFVARRVGRDAAPDLVAETFAIACRQSAPVTGPWLFGVARHLVLREWDDRTRSGELLDRLTNASASATGTADGESGIERLAAVRALARLSGPDRDLLIAVAWDDLPAREIAQVLGCSVSAFYVRLHRARRNLTRLLDEPGDNERKATRNNA